MSEKYALVVSDELSKWVSCKSIVANLMKSYNSFLSENEYKVFHLGQDANLYDCYLVAKEIKQYSPTHIAFIDHRPSVAGFLQALTKSYVDKTLPNIIIHVYGDFILELGDWLKLSDDLSRMNIQLICASEKQKVLLESLFLSNSKNIVCMAPFPVDTSHFNYDQEKRLQGRKKYQILNEEFVFLYTGRISLQKNVIELVQSFISAKNTLGLSAKLLLAGPFDDMGAPYLGLKSSHGSYQQQLVQLLSDLDENESVKYVGNHTTSSLPELYNVADCFVSTSTHNDEDFGMSPAEALICGLPLILTDWAGYSSFNFEEDEEICSLVPVNFEERSLRIDIVYLKKALLAHALAKVSLDKRKEISRVAALRYSIMSVGKRLRELLLNGGGRIESYDDKFYRAASTVNKNVKAPFSGDIGKFSDFYEQLYQPYWNKNN
jgi:glycosyltransferase involved in cell wall biosynthesis